MGCRQVLGKKMAGCLGTSGIVKTSHPRNLDLLPSAERGEDLGREHLEECETQRGEVGGGPELDVLGSWSHTQFRQLQTFSLAQPPHTVVKQEKGRARI